MLKAISTKNAIFPEDLINQAINLEYQEIKEEDKSAIEYYLGWDVALADSTSADYSAICVVSRANNRPLRVEEIWHEKIGEDEQFRIVTQLVRKYKIVHGYIEKKGISESIARKVCTYPELSGIIESWNPTNDSKANILGNVNLLMKHKMLKLDLNIRYTDKLKSEMMFFGIVNRNGNQSYKALSGHDDLVIGVCLAISAAGGWAFEGNSELISELI
jgi:hypothetical protein